MKNSKVLVQRKKHNEDLINRMKQGESLQNQSTSDSWFLPRPVIKKNSAALKELYVPEELHGEELAASPVNEEAKENSHLRLA